MKKLQKISIIAVLFLIVISACTKVNAVSATIKANKTKINIGETATITVSVNAAAWNIKVSGPATINEADSSEDGENTNKTFTTTFKATKAGNYDFKLSGDVTDGTTLTPQSISGNVKIEVSDNSNTSNTTNNNNTSTSTVKKVSSDATLKDLGIKPNDFSGFKKTKTSYDVTVPYSTEKINIYAKANNSNARILGTGNKNLKVGYNVFYIKVVAEDKKTTKTYTLNITRKKQDTTEQVNTEEKKPEKEEDNKESENNKEDSNTKKFLLKDIKIENYKLIPDFNPEIYEYKVNILRNISSLDITTEKSEENVEVKIEGNDNLKVGENEIVISASSKDVETPQTYKIKATIVEEKIDVTKYNYECQKVYAGVIQKNWMIQGTLCLIAIMSVIFVIAKHFIRKNDDYYDDDENEDNNDAYNKDDNYYEKTIENEFTNQYSTNDYKAQFKKPHFRIKSRAKGRRYK